MGHETCMVETGNSHIFIISGFRREVDEICALLGYYAAHGGNSLPTFQDNLSAPSTRVKNSRPGITTKRCVIPQKTADLGHFSPTTYN